MRMKRTGKIVVTLFTVLLLVLTAACAPTVTEEEKVVTEGEVVAPPLTSEPMPAVEWGIVEIRVTDPPPADVVSAVVYLTNMEVHQVADNGSGWISIPLGDNVSSFDLMDVIGVVEVLGNANIMAGKYTQIRMDVERVEVVTVDGDNFTAEIPSGKLKIVKPFDIGAGMTTVLTLDFDGEKSLIVTGKGKALFKPVVKLLVEKPEKVKEMEEEGEAEETESEGNGGVGEETGEDTAAPVITITGVSDGQVIVSPDTGTPEFSVSDDTDLNPAVVATLNGETFISGTVVSEVGEYELEVTAIDAGGNEAEVAVSFEILQE